MSDPFLRCDKCNQRATAEMDDKRHCELLDRLNAENARLRKVLMDVEDLTDKGTAVIFPDATLKEIQKMISAALDGDTLLHDDNGLRLDGREPKRCGPASKRSAPEPSAISLWETMISGR